MLDIARDVRHSTSCRVAPAFAPAPARRFAPRPIPPVPPFPPRLAWVFGGSVWDRSLSRVNLGAHPKSQVVAGRGDCDERSDEQEAVSY